MGRTKCARRGQKSRAGLAAMAVTPPMPSTITNTSHPMVIPSTDLYMAKIAGSARCECLEYTPRADAIRMVVHTNSTKNECAQWVFTAGPVANTASLRC
ncbi:hypothetical protein ATCV1_z302L [Acanthocystis turfacea chlorella virus 1]|uniref:Uncharacterized protein z302L n=1 Tax=Chlorovirus heliozoae TaxID=322019 RepID=A7K8R2_9PHYC|nr:hypothetical protein ATCV1_z302L [Acanthocystis turfacea chlorella virus 1]ABT16436.1 hypothetical protein ATCV1_z302L [Acanthocystis turfacea chlorella virus 1]